MKKSIIINFLCVFTTFSGFCQIERTYNWYFGDKAGIDFSSGQAVAVTDGQMSVVEGNSSISDKQGNLLMYTDGKSVWNRNHQIMPNGIELMGCLHAAQAALIIPKPLDDNIYYIFTVDGWDGTGGLWCNDYQNGFRYSIVDMTLDGGLGDVTEKNVLIHAPSTEQLAAVHHANCVDIWIMTHDLTQPKFYAYLLTSEGLNMSPVVSNIGDTNVPVFNNWYDGAAGYYKFSPNGKKFAAARYSVNNPDIIKLNTLELYDFDNRTGILSNLIPLKTPFYGYGVSFSPDNSKLYYAAYINLYQFDISSNDSLTIVNSMTHIASATAIDDIIYANAFIALQIGADNKIYIAKYRYPALADTIPIIQYPNEKGVNCGFIRKGFCLAGNASWEGLPNLPESYYDKNTSTSCFTNKSNEEQQYFIPNIFSPNADGNNDVLYVRGNNIEQLYFAIYSRWGQKVFETKDINRGWDGTFKGKQSETGVYVYFIEATLTSGKQITRKGNLTLLR